MIDFLCSGSYRACKRLHIGMYVCKHLALFLRFALYLHVCFIPFCLNFHYFTIKKACDTLSHFPSFDDCDNLLRSLFSLIALFNCNFYYTLSHYCYFLIYCLLLLASRKCLSHSYLYTSIYVCTYISICSNPSSDYSSLYTKYNMYVCMLPQLTFLTHILS